MTLMPVGLNGLSIVSDIMMASDFTLHAAAVLRECHITIEKPLLPYVTRAVNFAPNKNFHSPCFWVVTIFCA
jgi:hypothetical protein